jgi:hypothetical protein
MHTCTHLQTHREMQADNGFFFFLMCSNIVDVSSYDELKVAISQGKWARGPWSARYFFFVLYPLRTCISGMLLTYN